MAAKPPRIGTGARCLRLDMTDEERTVLDAEVRDPEASLIRLPAQVDIRSVERPSEADHQLWNQISEERLRTFGRAFVEPGLEPPDMLHDSGDRFDIHRFRPGRLWARSRCEQRVLPGDHRILRRREQLVRRDVSVAVGEDREPVFERP